MDLVLTYRFKKLPDEVLKCFVDPVLFVKTHPIITRLESTGGNNYRVFETLRWHFFSFKFRYRASIESNEEKNSVITNAVVMNLVKIKTTIWLQVEKNETLIREDILFQSVLPVKAILKAIFKKQHNQWFKNINDL